MVVPPIAEVMLTVHVPLPTDEIVKVPLDVCVPSAAAVQGPTNAIVLPGAGVTEPFSSVTATVAVSLTAVNATGGGCQPPGTNDPV